MAGRRALTTIAALAASGGALAGAAHAAHAQPAGEIEIEPAPTARTDQPAKDARAARRWIAAGQLLMQRGNYLAARNRGDDAKAQFDNAVTAFHKALEAGDPNVRLELAAAEDRLGKTDEAVKQLRALVATAAGVRPDVLRKAITRLDELSARIGLVTLTVTPPGASITLGGIELGTAPLPEPLVLMPGTYTLAFQADGFQPKEAEIRVDAGSENERAIQLDAVRIVVQPVQPARSEPVPVAPPAPRSKLPLYVGAGVTGAGAIGAAVFGILAVGRHATFTGQATSKLDREDARTAGERFALIADASLGVAVVAAGLTASWYLFKSRQHPGKPEDRRSPPISAKLDVVPWVQSQSSGVTIAGSF